MNRSFHRFALTGALLLTLPLMGCVLSQKDKKPPEQAVGEMALYGITLSMAEGPFPSSLLTKYTPEGDNGNGYVDVGNSLDLYFPPDPDHAVFEELSEFISTLSVYPYDYTFSVADGTGTSFAEIPSTGGVLDPNLDFSAPLDRYLGSVRQDGVVEEFVLFGDYALVANVVSIPVRATHGELWYRDQPEAERRLVNRVALADLTAYRVYVKPVIEQASGS